MTKQEIIVIGSGRRIQRDVLPCLRASERFHLAGIYARKEKIVDQFPVKPLRELSGEILKKTQWIFLSVTSEAVPGVLKYLSSFSVGHIHLLLDTPVLPSEQENAEHYLTPYLKSTAAEDIIELPWIQPVKDLLGGEIRELVFNFSAYKYHGIALIKRLTDSLNFKDYRIKSQGGHEVLELNSENGAHSIVVEPRDYSKGSMTFSGPKGSITDGSEVTEFLMKPIISNHRCLGLEIGDREIKFSEAESVMIATVAEGATITSLTLELKRVALLRLMHQLIDNPDSGWSIANAKADTRFYQQIENLRKLAF